MSHRVRNVTYICLNVGQRHCGIYKKSYGLVTVGTVWAKSLTTVTNNTYMLL